MILVDTSVLINFFKNRATKGTMIFSDLSESDFCITPIVYQEILQGAKDKKEFETLKEYLGTQLFCYPLNPILSFEHAAKIYFDCRRNGITLRSTVDCLIAQIAIDNSLRLLHDDEDFIGMAKFCKLKLVV